MAARNIIEAMAVAGLNARGRNMGTALFPRRHPGLTRTATPPPAPQKRELR